MKLSIDRLQAMLLATFAATQTVACDTDVSNSDTSPAFTQWEGQWIAVEPLVFDPAMENVMNGIDVLRPDYSREQVDAYIHSMLDVDYSAVTFSGENAVFSRGSIVLCSARYAAIVSDETGAHDHGDDGHEHDEQGTQAGPTEAVLEQVVEGDCTNYARLWLSAQHPQPPESHFHLVHGPLTGPLHPAPWAPSVWTPTTSPQWFADFFAQSTQRFADALPVRTGSNRSPTPAR